MVQVLAAIVVLMFVVLALVGLGFLALFFATVEEQSDDSDDFDDLDTDYDPVGDAVAFPPPVLDLRRVNGSHVHAGDVGRPVTGSVHVLSERERRDSLAYVGRDQISTRQRMKHFRNW